MPVPSVEEWEWLNWKFPRAVHAGDTIFARWTLTQKRPPIGAAATSIVVWRVDVHTADGALCAEGEVGAKVRRHLAPRERERAQEMPAAAAGVAAGVAAGPRRRRRRRPAGADAHTVETPVVAAAPAAPAVPVARPERVAGTGAPRRRRRRRPSGTTAAGREGEAAGSPAPPPDAPPPAPAASPTAPATERGGLGGVIRRLRQPRRS
jgi:hypothetical protein